ncbi:protein mid1-complementing activity 2 [Quercus suber]|uniref:Protein mid1-complementing activity 2 n=1 Tax=Quercus suber TaxID=58331 RepID=A0AAW0LAI2_QUESU
MENVVNVLLLRRSRNFLPMNQLMDIGLKPEDQSQWQTDLFDCCSKPCLSFKTWVYPCGTFSWIANLGGSCDDFSPSSHVLLLRTSSRVASSTGLPKKKDDSSTIPIHEALNPLYDGSINSTCVPVVAAAMSSFCQGGGGDDRSED